MSVPQRIQREQVEKTAVVKSNAIQMLYGRRAKTGKDQL